MTTWPWIIKHPWYIKVWRVFHCIFSMMGEVVYLDYIIEDLKTELAKER